MRPMRRHPMLENTHAEGAHLRRARHGTYTPFKVSEV